MAKQLKRGYRDAFAPPALPCPVAKAKRRVWPAAGHLMAAAAQRTIAKQAQAAIHL
jgi:hypothetical protein